MIYEAFGEGTEGKYLEEDNFAYFAYFAFLHLFIFLKHILQFYIWHVLHISHFLHILLIWYILHRVHNCHDCHDRRSCKIFVSCVNFPRKQRIFLHILQVYTHLMQTFFITVEEFTQFFSRLTKKGPNY